MVFFISQKSCLKINGKDLKGMTVAVSGSGNVAIYATEKAQQLGAKVVTVSDSTWMGIRSGRNRCSCIKRDQRSKPCKTDRV